MSASFGFTSYGFKLSHHHLDGVIHRATLLRGTFQTANALVVPYNAFFRYRDIHGTCLVAGFTVDTRLCVCFANICIMNQVPPNDYVVALFSRRNVTNYASPMNYV